MEITLPLPNFFILGGAKCGTTSLYHYLKQHPQIYLPKDKEPHFFDQNIFWRKGVEQYLIRHFNGAENYKARGEATPAYFRLPTIVIPRIMEVYNQDIPKFIVILRNPIERAWSHYLHMVRNCMEKESFKNALELENKRLQSDPQRWIGYFSDGLYASLFQDWFDAFPQKNFLIILTEDLKNSFEETMEKICLFLTTDSGYRFDSSIKANTASEARFKFLMDFIAKPPSWIKPLTTMISDHRKKRIFERITSFNRKKIKVYPEIPEETKKYLLNSYTADIKRLEKIIDRDLSHWLK